MSVSATDPMTTLDTGAEAASVLPLLRRVAEARGAHPAVEDAGRTLTYGALVRQVEGLAGDLRRAGVGEGALVGVAMERSVDAVVAILAVLEAGGAYVPVDVRYPAERVAFTLRDAGVALILADAGTLPHVAETGRPVALVQGDRLMPGAHAAADGRRIAGAAYVIYTSGSTGRPKGVVVGQAALAAYAAALGERLGIRPDDRYLHTASFAFSSSVRQWVLPLLNGATLVVAPREAIADARALLQLLHDRQVTVADLVPSYLAGCVQALRDADAGVRRDLLRAPLRLLLTASEPLPAALARAWRDELRAPGTLVNMYGQTETCGIVATWPVPAAAGEGVVPIGEPIPGVELLVLDAEGRAVPEGEPGELVVTGPTLAFGYVGMDAATRERFPVATEGALAGTRLYRSGDRVRRRADGALEFLGRADTQVKVRGHRVELEEIEARLVAHPDVREAAVRAEAGPDGGTMLAAFAVPAVGRTPDARAVRRFVAAGVPDYMVPAVVHLVAALPRTPNGKLDRPALAALDAGRPAVTAEFVAPATADERAIAAIWTELLGGVPVGAADDFFELGGHSLLAMRLVARLRAAFSVELPISVIFERPTVQRQAEAVAAARLAPVASRPPLVARPAGSPVVPSFAQQRLWLLHQMDPTSAAYNLHAAIRLVGRLDRAALERAVTEVLARHEALRTVFPAVDGAPRAEVRPVEPVALPPVVVPDEAALRARVAHEAAQPFDLATGPLVRAELLQLTGDEHVLLLVMHHIVSDGWSRGVLYDELAQLYSAFAAGQPSPLAPLPVQFADVAAWQEAWVAGEAVAAQQQWWKQALAGAPATSEFPTPRPRPALAAFRGATHRFPIPADLVADVRRLGGETGASPFMIYLAAFAALLARQAGQEEVVIGSPTAGRPEPATEPLIGFFVNTLALRLSLEGQPTFRDLVHRAREMALGAFAHQDLPFDRVVEALNLPRDLSRAPLFQVMLILQNTPPATYRPAGLVMSQLDVDAGGAKYDVTLSLVAGEHGMTGQLEYNTDLFDAATIERLAGHFTRLLEAGVRTPDRPAHALPMLTAPEERQLLDEWNATAVPVEAATVHGAFEAQVRRTPDATALVFEDRTLTYRELDERATLLARHLRTLGVGRETLVGLCVERSLELMVGLIAIHKAGAAYVPLDPSYPRERLAFMVEDSGCPVILTQERLLGHVPAGGATLVCLDRDWARIAATPATPLPPVAPEQIAYVIFTSGSTGRPKGVMVEHRNVVNFFAGMDERLGTTPGVWLAVTSVSFDISVLELCWTLARGFTVVVQGEEPRIAARPGVSTRPIGLGLFYWGTTEVRDGANPYHMLLESARFADDHGFSAVWVPERHFHGFGGTYPSPATVAGALAALTRRVQLRSGSVVLPLHDPVRVAEDWSVVDVLSQGRVGLAFASGWHDRDFIFQPHNYADRREVLFREIETVRRLWRGEAISRMGGAGKAHEIRTLPRPVQAELPVWVTAAGSPDTYRTAGRLGCHLLTHLLGQTLDQVRDKIRLYRQAWDEAGHPGRGTVSLMMHTFVGDDIEQVKQVVWHPFREYLRTALDLIGGLAKDRGQDLRDASFSAADMEALLDHAFHRYFDTSALLGTPDSCTAMLERVKALDVDDVACLVDFGVPEADVLGMLPKLAEVLRRANPHPVEAAVPTADWSVPAQIARHGVTHMQCTPSFAEMLLAQPGGREALARLDCLMVGGEAMAGALARDLALTVRGRVLNMYGPTETTIWSTTARVQADAPLTLGRPIANTELYVVDRALAPVPVGVPGELLIGGDGVVRGYWQRAELTAERFVPHPRRPGARLYRTGDLVRYRADGTVEFLGRLDHQVKVRGHRIELGEIEALLREQSGVRESVVMAREDVPGDKRLVGYVVLAAPEEDAEARLRDALRARLPEWMVPQHVVTLEALPRTPNGKTDRHRLPAPETGGRARGAAFVPPAGGVEQAIAEVWQDVLRRTEVGSQDNFFDLGGHSLLVVRVQARLREKLGRAVAITDLFRFPTIRALAEHLGGAGEPTDTAAPTEAATERASARRQALARRRGRRDEAEGADA